MNPATAELAAFVKPREKNEKEVPQTGGAQGDDWDQPLKIDGVFDQDTAVFFGKWAQMQNNLNKVRCCLQLWIASSVRIQPLGHQSRC